MAQQIYGSTDTTQFAPTADDFYELDEEHERSGTPAGWYRCRVVMVNSKGFQRILFVDTPALPWRSRWTVSFEGPEWRAMGFEGIYKVTDFSVGGYDENIHNLGIQTARYELRRFMGIPQSTANVRVPTPPGTILLALAFIIWVIVMIVRSIG